MINNLILKYPKQGEEFIDTIIATICAGECISIEQVESKSRLREIVKTRQIAMYFAKKFTTCSLTTIGSKIGGKDHATVLHACKTVNNLCDTDISFRGDLTVYEMAIGDKIKKAESDFLVCSKCGSSSVLANSTVVLDPNTLKVVSPKDSLNFIQHFCLNCNEHTVLTSRETFINKAMEVKKEDIQQKEKKIEEKSDKKGFNSFHTIDEQIEYLERELNLK